MILFGTMACFHNLKDLISGVIFLLLLRICIRILVALQNKVTNFFKCEKGVRQGCPLSPILFNIFIYTLALDLDKSSTDSLELPNGSRISCLMYADDVILISKSPEGVNKIC